MNRKYAAILALTLLAVLFLPETLFAQGAVIGYADGKTWIGTSQYPHYTNFPSDAQLTKLTHMIASDIGCRADGTLYTRKLPENWSGTPPPNYIWNGSKNLWLESLVSRAHQEGIKVSICVGGDYFTSATSSSTLATFVANIVSFVNLHGLDGVDINWEYPGRISPGVFKSVNEQIADWSQCAALLKALKTSPSLSCKRISMALSAAEPTNSTWYPAQTTPIPQQIWNAADAIHLMTYDQGWQGSHSNAASSTAAIDAWANWGTSNLNKKKLHIGCAFHGWPQVVGTGNRVPYSTYSGGGFSGNRGDLPSDVATKVNHCYSNGYGGVFIWELGYDANTSTTPTLQNTIWTANNNKGGFTAEILCPPAISGPTLICSGSSATFTIQNWQNSQSIQWIPGPYLTKTGGSGNQATFVANGNGVSWIDATVNGTPLTRFNVGVGPPVITSLVQYGNPYYNPTVINYRPTYNALSSPTGFNYSVSPMTGGVLIYLLSNSNGSVQFVFPKNGSYLITAKADNVCGTGSNYLLPVSITTNRSYVYQVYPNPASNTLNIEIGKDTDSQALEQNTGDDRLMKANFSYDIRLYDGQGNLLRHKKTKGGKVELNVANLTNGIYYLHIYDGVNEKPDMRQIVVEH